MSTTTDCALKGWHPGEAAVQGIMHLPERVSITAVVKKLPEQHRIFHTTRLHFLPFTSLDSRGRPWASILTSRDGKPAFIRSPSETTLVIDACIWDGDPIVENVRDFDNRTETGKMLVSAVGIEVSTRRRNKFAGYVSNVSLREGIMSLTLTVNQALGLCPKYINVRSIMPHPQTRPRVAFRQMNVGPNDRLPDEVISFIHNADTAYLATSYVASAEDQDKFPSHVSTNHRGGRPGFVRVRPSDGRTLVLPNYSGNRLMNSLGNIYVTPLAGLVFPSFSDGSILYVTGTAETLFGQPAQDLMPLVNVLTAICVTGFAFVKDALPIRQSTDIEAERSPYSPPVRYLAEEKPPASAYDDITVSLLRVKVHDASLATFTFESSRPIEIRPSQNTVLELSQFLRVRSHELIEWTESADTENDDCVRTWTVSIPPTRAAPCVFSITMRMIKGGLITPLLYRIARDASQHSADGQADVSAINITARLRGVGGNLPAPEPIAACDGGRRLLWLAGGIGLTPFISLTRHVADLVAGTYGVWDIVLVLSAREPDVMLDLIADALQALKGTAQPCDLSYVIHLFCPTPPKPSSNLPSFVTLHVHTGRLAESGEFFKSVDAKDRESHICGPLPFVLTAMKAMQNAGVNPEHVKRERFTY